VKFECVRGTCPYPHALTRCVCVCVSLFRSSTSSVNMNCLHPSRSETRRTEKPGSRRVSDACCRSPGAHRTRGRVHSGNDRAARLPTGLTCTFAAGHILEIGALISVRVQDVSDFERYLAQLKWYYYDLRQVYRGAGDSRARQRIRYGRRPTAGPRRRGTVHFVRRTRPGAEPDDGTWRAGGKSRERRAM
jgi:hypothetical protein